MSKNTRYNPFRNYPILTPQDFIGREKELNILLESMFKASEKRITNQFFIEGGNCIGKTSLLNQIEQIAKGDLFLINKLNYTSGKNGFYFLVGRTDTFSATNSFTDIIKTLLESLRNNLTTMQKIKLRSVDLTPKILLSPFLEVEIKSTDRLATIPASYFNEFYSILMKINQLASSDREGIILIFDNMNDLIDKCNYGNFFKILLEKFQNDNLTNILIFISGNRETFEKLLQQESSINRFIDIVNLKKFSEVECINLIQSAFYKIKLDIDHEVLTNIYTYTNGFPDYVQQTGIKIYQADYDNYIGMNDFKVGITDVINLYENEIYIAYKKTDFNHKSILKELLKSEDEIPTSSFIKHFYSKQQLQSCLTRLIKLGLIIIEGDFCKFKNLIVKICIDKIMKREESI